MQGSTLLSGILCLIIHMRTLILVSHGFFLFCCSRRHLFRYEHSSEGSQLPAYLVSRPLLFVNTRFWGPCTHLLSIRHQRPLHPHSQGRGAGPELSQPERESACPRYICMEYMNFPLGSTWETRQSIYHGDDLLFQ